MHMRDFFSFGVVKRGKDPYRLFRQTLKENMMHCFIKWPIYMLLCLLWFSEAYAADVPKTLSPPTPPDSSVSASSQKVPVIQLPETSHDFGEVPEGNTIRYDFKVKNTGEEVLKIERVRPG